MEADRVRQPRFSTANPAIAKQAIQHSQQQLLLPTDSPSGGQIDEASSGGGPSGVKLVKPFPVKKVPPTATLVDAVSKSPAVDGLQRDVVNAFVPRYTRFFEKYSRYQFSKKNMDEYLKYPPSRIEKMLSALFESQ